MSFFLSSHALLANQVYRNAHTSLQRRFRHLSMAAECIVGSRVQLLDGQVGVIIDKKGGWLKVNVTATNGKLSFVNVRKSDLTSSPADFLGESDTSGQRVVVTGPRAIESTLIKGNVHAGPLIHELNTPPAQHAMTDRWLVFSDLHVKAASIEICEEVLERVHEEASARKAGIIFLGDFWHVRGKKVFRVR